jgi:hypothetical protein
MMCKIMLVVAVVGICKKIIIKFKTMKVSRMNLKNFKKLTVVTIQPVYNNHQRRETLLNLPITVKANNLNYKPSKR